VKIDQWAPLERLRLAAASVSLDLGGRPTLVARDLRFDAEASLKTLAAWLPGDPIVHLRPDGRFDLTRSGWDHWVEVPVTVRVVDGVARFEVDALVVRGWRLPAPKRFHQRRRLDPATYHPGLRFESITPDPAAKVVRATLTLGEWREPVSLGQLLDLRGRLGSLGRQAPLLLRSLVGGQ
jgi:hypothetical protein